MNIALIRQRYTPYGGAERFVARAMEALEREGARLTIVARRWDKAERASLICNPFYLGSLWRDWGFARCVCRALGMQRFDLVQSHERIACCDVYRAGDGVHRVWLQQRGRVLGTLKRLSLRLSFYHRYTLSAERRLFTSSRLRAVICNSEMVKREIRTHFDVPENKLHVIYSGVDTRAFHPDVKAHRMATRARLGISAESTVFLFVGSGFERKGLGAAIAALTKLPPQAHLLVVGKDKRLARLRDEAKTRGLGERVHFVGAQNEIASFYGAADAFVLPTLYDPLPNAALEAMACGLPVITSTHSGAAELIDHGRNGFVVDALDIDGLARAMHALLDADRCSEAGDAARRTIEPYTLDAMAERLTNLYRALLTRAQ